MPIVVRVLIALVVAVLLYLMSVRLIRSMMRPGPPDEPDIENLRPVDYRYRCTVCGAEVTMTAAPGDDVPDPPRHCRDDMTLISDSS